MLQRGQPLERKKNYISCHCIPKNHHRKSSWPFTAGWPVSFQGSIHSIAPPLMCLSSHPPTFRINPRPWKGPSDGEPPLSPLHHATKYTVHKTYYNAQQWRLDGIMLTLDCTDYTVAIFYHIFEKFARPVQLQLVTFKCLSELRTVQIAVAELKRRMPHCFGLVGQKKKKK